MIRPLGIFLALALLTGCTGPSSHPGNAQNKDNTNELVIKSIVVLQSEHDLVDQGSRSAEARNLDEGTKVLSATIAEHFAMRDNVTPLSATKQESLTGTFIGNHYRRALHIGTQAKADAVLTTRLIEYRKLTGKEYGADEPASVSFDYSLIHVASGNTLCRGSYEETQKTLFSDILSFGKASKRKFKFVSAATLLREGVERKFEDCRYLATPVSTDHAPSPTPY